MTDQEVVVVDDHDGDTTCETSINGLQTTSFATRVPRTTRPKQGLQDMNSVKGVPSFDSVSEFNEITLTSTADIGSLAGSSLSTEGESEFGVIFSRAQEAIEAGIYPQLIPSGSSGSYFVFDRDRKIIAVFKPCDEEPFAPLNPKWPKFFQRMLCFCCFGRACLIPNHGYLSETAASLVDERLGLKVVPKTRVVRLASPTFNYGHRRKNTCLTSSRFKKGSFQLFVEGYRSAAELLAEWENSSSALTPAEEKKFTILFQKLCVLDYVIRNTDRHTENWLIRHVPEKELDIAVIDNGLAFPVKHPECASRFRQFPFHWADLKYASLPLDEDLRCRLLSLLTPAFVSVLSDELMTLFRKDKSHNRLLTFSQIRVFRGQLWNLRDALAAGEPPVEWVKRDPILVKRRKKNILPECSFDECFRRRRSDCANRVCC